MFESFGRPAFNCNIPRSCHSSNGTQGCFDGSYQKSWNCLELPARVRQARRGEKKLKASLLQITKDKKKANRKARALKLKASKINLSDLLQMMMMKAFVLSEEEAEKNGARSSSSSGEPWRPKNAKEAFEKIVEVTNSKEAAEVAKFAKELQSEVSE